MVCWAKNHIDPAIPADVSTLLTMLARPGLSAPPIAMIEGKMGPAAKPAGPRKKGKGATG